MDLRTVVDKFIATGGSSSDIPTMIGMVAAACQAAPHDCDTLSAAARFLGAIAQWDLAESMARQALAAGPRRPDLYSGLADILWRSGRNDEAVAVLMGALDSCPEDPRNHENVIALLHHLKRHNDVEHFSARAEEMGVVTPSILTHAGLSLIQAGRRDAGVARLFQAMDLLERADRCARGSAVLMRLPAALAESLFHLGRLDEMFTQAEALRRLAPGSADLRYWLGRAAVERGQWAAALNVLDEALDLLPADLTASQTEASIRLLRGDAAYQMGRVGAAVSDLQTGLDRLRESLSRCSPATRFGAHRPEGLRADRGQRPKAYHLVSIVWGREYSDMLLRFLLPCLLAPRNASALRSLPSVYRFFSTKEDFAHIRQSPVFRRLEELTEVELIPVDTSIRDDMARYMACQQQAVLAAEQADAALLPLTVDAIINDGYLPYLVEQMEAGRRAVMNIGPRVDKAQCAALLESSGARQPDGSLVLPSRLLTSIACRSMHPVGRSLFADSPEILGGGPYHIYWDLPGVGFLAKGFSLDPLCIYSVVKGVKLVSTVDMYYVYQAIPDFDDILVNTDSDNIIGVSLTPAEQVRDPRRVEKADPEYGLLKSAWWVLNEADPHQRRFAQTDIIIHHQDITPEIASVRQHAQSYVSALLEKAFVG